MTELLRAALAVDAEASRSDAILEEISDRVATLTEREVQVMNLIVNGLSNKDVGAELGISLKTVESHRAKVMSKMHSESFAELVTMVARWRESKGPR